ncbi:hypothetical protein GCM10011405_32670 [Rufibacter glacialis]|nr:hypothetical protein GCM10011405_32670 [Rufibacter glacialis]
MAKSGFGLGGVNRKTPPKPNPNFKSIHKLSPYPVGVTLSAIFARTLFWSNELGNLEEEAAPISWGFALCLHPHVKKEIGRFS